MKDFSKTHLTFLVLFLVVGLGGGYFWWWSIGNLELKERSKTALSGKITQVDKKGLPPTQAVLSKLEANEKAFRALSEKSVEELRQNLDLFDSVLTKREPGKQPEGLSPDVWKKLMNEKRLALDKLAAKEGVPVPKETAYYGFQKYRVPNPEQKFTGPLGIQLLALNELSTILIETGVTEYTSAKRVFVEEKGGPNPGGGEAGESLGASVLTGPDGLYEVYPFEIWFRGTTQDLRDVINRVGTSKYFFVIRFVSIENKANVKSKSTIQTELTAEANRSGTLMVPVAGNEYLNVVMRIDLLVWSKPALEAAK